MESQTYYVGFYFLLFQRVAPLLESALERLGFP